MSRPLIQIDDEVREMTDEEYSVYLNVVSQQNVGTTEEELSK